MIDSVWWYVLAGFLLGFILSTLWEWLYFRRRRMRIENQRIAELETTVRTLSTTSHTAETTGPAGFAMGYQSPLVFLEGEDDDVDTVEVIVPAAPEPVNVAADPQLHTETQFVAAKAAPGGRPPANNGNGVETSPSSVSPAAVAAGAAGATAFWERHKEQPADSSVEVKVESPLPSEQPPDETLPTGAPLVYVTAPAQEQAPGLVGDLAPSKHTGSVGASADAVDHGATPPRNTEQPAQVEQQEGVPPAAAALARAEPGAAAQTTPSPPLEWEEQGQAVQAEPPAPNPDEDAGLTTAGIALIASALASKLTGEQQDSQEPQQPAQTSQASQTPQPPQVDQADQAAQAQLPAASAQAGLPTPEPAPGDMPPTRAVPGIYELPDGQPETTAGAERKQQEPHDDIGGVNAQQNADLPLVPGSVPASSDEQAAQEAVGTDVARGQVPGADTQQELEPALPLSAILPRATRTAPLSKTGQAPGQAPGQPRRQEPAQANSLAASGIEPEIEQVSNQLDDLIESINGLIERTQPLLDQPQRQAPLVEIPATSPNPTAAGANSAGADFGAGFGAEEGEGEEAGTGVTGPYSAQNLSRMEYGLVQLMQAVRRLGSDVRSAF